MRARPQAGALLPQEQIAALRKRRLWSAPGRIALNVAVYAALALVVTRASLGPARYVAWPAMGFVLAGFYAAVHDCWHQNLFASRAANRAVGVLFSAPLLKNFTVGKTSHFVHHRFTRISGDNEPRFDFTSYRQYLGALWNPSLSRSLALSLRLLVGGSLPGLTDDARRSARLDAAAVLAWLVVAAALTTCSPQTMAEVYWGALAFFPTMVVVVALPEHHGCESGPEVLVSTRSTVSNGLVRALIWNSNYHAEHHLYPSMPSSSLPAAHRLLRARLRNVAPGYVAFHFGVLRDIANCRRRHRFLEVDREASPR